MVDPSRGEQRFASLTYSLIARWLGYQPETVKKYANKGKYRDKKFDPRDMENALQWVGEICASKGRVPPWEKPSKPQDIVARELGFWCYDDYLASDLWREIRGRLLPGPCATCGQPAFCVHHQEYTIENMSGESTKGLMPLCERHHAPLHAINCRDILPIVAPAENSSKNSQPIPTGQAPETSTGGHATQKPRENQPETDSKVSHFPSVQLGHTPNGRCNYNPETGEFNA